MKNLVALGCGLLFGIGLAVSGMTDTAKVLGFLDIFGAWKPDLLFVMGSAVCVTLLAFTPVLRRRAPFLAPGFSMPTKTTIDPSLLSGAAVFGIGWGLYGYCPGPALSSLVYLQPNSAVFVVAMLSGMFLASRLPPAVTALKSVEP
jgi:uncharacterized membrane protein YedE/YeeE